MKNKMTLVEYLKNGGNLHKVDWSEAKCDYGDKNRDAKILSFEDRGDRNGEGCPLFYFTFDNGNTHRYSISWIILNVDVVLADRYK